MNNLYLTEEVKSITDQLISKYHPETIIFFGSAAHGRFDEEKSDLDFLIIKKNVPYLGRQRIYELDKLIEYHIASDFIVYTPDEIKKLYALNDPFIHSILQECTVLYGQKPAFS